MPSDQEFASLEKETRDLIESVIQTFGTAPAPTERPPCAVMIAPILDTFQSSMTLIAENRTVSKASVIRSDYGALLDALVNFANSTWTLEERVAFERCDCKGHSVDYFQDFYREISELRDDCEERSTLREIVIQVFLILVSVVTDIKNNDGEIIKLEKNRKRRKWPSSPSQFIPRGAATAVPAFMKWARLAQHAAPLDALCQIASCSPSVLSAMNDEEALLPLLDTLFTQHITWLRQLDFVNISAPGLRTLEQGMNNFLNVCCSGWFQDQMAFAEHTRTNAHAFTPLYHTLCTLVSLLKTMAFRMKNAENLAAAFGVAALTMRSSLSAFAPVPLHPALTPFVAVHNQLSSPYVMMMDSVALRNQQKCVAALCLRTGEPTKSNFKQCSGCQAVRYCSKECQVVDWKQHKHICKLLKVLMPIALLQHHQKPGILSPKIADEFYDKVKHAGLTEQDIAHVCKYIRDHSVVIIGQDNEGYKLP